MNSPVHANPTASPIDATAVAQVEAVLSDDCDAYTDDDAQIEPTHR